MLIFLNIYVHFMVYRRASKIKEMLEKIDRRQLAQAAFHCGSHTRALQYLESLLCEKKQGGLNPSAGQSASFADNETSFLMQVMDRE